jgi:hypothetical protein
MIVLAEPAPEDMVQAIKKAINMLRNIDPQAMHLRVSQNPLYLCVNLLKHWPCPVWTFCITSFLGGKLVLIQFL